MLTGWGGGATERGLLLERPAHGAVSSGEASQVCWEGAPRGHGPGVGPSFRETAFSSLSQTDDKGEERESSGEKSSLSRAKAG